MCIYHYDYELGYTLMRIESDMKIRKKISEILSPCKGEEKEKNVIFLKVP